MLVEGFIAQEINRKQIELEHELAQNKHRPAPLPPSRHNSVRHRFGCWLVQAGCRVAGYRECDCGLTLPSANPVSA